jgi:hypothetical protein
MLLSTELSVSSSLCGWENVACNSWESRSTSHPFSLLLWRSWVTKVRVWSWPSLSSLEIHGGRSRLSGDTQHLHLWSRACMPLLGSPCLLLLSFLWPFGSAQCNFLKKQRTKLNSFVVNKGHVYGGKSMPSMLNSTPSSLCPLGSQFSVSRFHLFWCKMNKNQYMHDEVIVRTTRKTTFTKHLVHGICQEY